MKRILCLAILLCSCSSQPPEPVRQVNFDTPRPFGYVLGDEITHSINFETDEDIILQTERLPPVGALNRWLNLNTLLIDKQKHNGISHYVLTLRYQVFYAPLAVKLLTIPGFKITLLQQGKEVSVVVPAWAFNLSPLRELHMRKTEHGEYKRSDAQPDLLENSKLRYAWWLSILLLASSALYLMWREGLCPVYFQQRVFKSAVRQLAGLRVSDMEQGLAIVHQALNNLYRQPLFFSHLEKFYFLYPEYKQLHSRWIWFFHYSNNFFFTDNFYTPSSAEWEKLCALCRAADEIERGHR